MHVRSNSTSQHACSLHKTECSVVSVVYVCHGEAQCRDRGGYITSSDTSKFGRIMLPLLSRTSVHARQPVSTASKCKFVTCNSSLGAPGPKL